MLRPLLYFLAINVTTAVFGQQINSGFLQKGMWQTDTYTQNEKSVYEQDTIKLNRILLFEPCSLQNYPRFKFHDKNQFDLLYDTPLDDTTATAIGKGKWEFNKKTKQLSLHYYNAKFGSKPGSDLDKIDTYRYNKTFLYKVITSSDYLIVLVRCKF